MSVGAYDPCPCGSGKKFKFCCAHKKTDGGFARALEHQRAGERGEAEALYRGILAAQPDNAEAHNNLGNVLQAREMLDEAVAEFRRAIALKGDVCEVYCNLGNALNARGQVEEAIAAYRQAVALRPDFAAAHSNLLFLLQYHPGYDGEAILREHREWNARHAQGLRRFDRPHANERDPERRLRIGYVSADLRNHPVGYNLLRPLAARDRRHFEVFCYSGVARPDALTRRFEALTDGWRTTVGMDDEALAGQIRKDRIDILVDLSLHTAQNRLLALARKPAPVQATFAGYPGTTGLSAMDYRLTDPYLDPPENDALYSERSLRLADCFWCYDPVGAQLPVNALPAEGNGAVTFGCLNNFCKVNDGVLALWARVLQETPGSRLIMLCPPGEHRARVAERLGVGGKRLEFVPRQGRLKYLEVYHRIDLGLDTFPYNGHTTSLDSFWMGVPVVTLAGRTAVGRAGLCQAMNLGQPELAAKDPEEFVRIAAGLAGDSPRLGELRRTLRGRMEKSALMDGARFARSLEGAYRQMWREWCATGT